MFERSFLVPAMSPTSAQRVDLSGPWHNQLKSDMRLRVRGGSVSGWCRTRVGKPQDWEKFDLTGFRAGDLLTFTVNFGKYGSLTAWVGQLTLNGEGEEEIRTLWHLAKDVPDEEEAEHLWATVLAGADNFRRGYAPDAPTDAEDE